MRFGGKGKNPCGLETSRNGDLRAQRGCTVLAPREPVTTKLPDKACSKQLPTSFQTDSISIILYHHIAIQAELFCVEVMNSHFCFSKSITFWGPGTQRRNRSTRRANPERPGRPTTGFNGLMSLCWNTVLEMSLGFVLEFQDPISASQKSWRVNWVERPSATFSLSMLSHVHQKTTATLGLAYEFCHCCAVVDLGTTHQQSKIAGCFGYTSPAFDVPAEAKVCFGQGCFWWIGWYRLGMPILPLVCKES